MSISSDTISRTYIGLFHQDKKLVKKVEMPSRSQTYFNNREKMNKTEDKIIKINNLKTQADKIRRFLTACKSSANVERGFGWDIDAIIKIKTEKSFSIFCSRWFGCGSHKQEIDVPNELIEELEHLAEKRLAIVNQELDSIL